MDASPAADDELKAFALGQGLMRAGERPVWRRLTGGVSSDVWRLDSGGRSYCLKRALGRLHVVADWRAPTGRSLYEWRWFETARQILPQAVPQPVAFDEARGILAMGFLEPQTHPLWKGQLTAGRVDPATAAGVGTRIGTIHAATAGRADIAARFDSDEMFFALRLEPFLLTPAERHPSVATALRDLCQRTARTRLALVHGDVSPKNILVGPDGPVFLDAETAWYGDPAFDLAFCTMHLMLKHLVVPGQGRALSACITALVDSYLPRVTWEAREGLEARAAALVPALMLARVDGKSPVEYLPALAQKEAVRRFTLPLLTSPLPRIEQIRAAWVDAIGEV